MSTNLEKYRTSNNQDWSLWCKLVREAHKRQGIVLSQPQVLLIAKNSYPGKGNVVCNQETLNVPVSKPEEIPPNPPRTKKVKAPKGKEPVYGRDRNDDRGWSDYDRGGRRSQPREPRYVEERDGYYEEGRSRGPKREPRYVEERDGYYEEGRPRGSPRRYRRSPSRDDYRY